MITRIKKPMQYVIGIMLIPFLYLSTLALIDDIDKYGIGTAAEYLICCVVVMAGILRRHADMKEYFAFSLLVFLVVMDTVNLTY